MAQWLLFSGDFELLFKASVKQLLSSDDCICGNNLDLKCIAFCCSTTACCCCFLLDKYPVHNTIVTYIAACLYGDRSLGCPILVPEDTEQCTSDQEDACCETCYQLTVTTPATTVNPCQGTVSYDWRLRHSTLNSPFRVFLI